MKNYQKENLSIWIASIMRGTGKSLINSSRNNKLVQENKVVQTVLEGETEYDKVHIFELMEYLRSVNIWYKTALLAALLIVYSIYIFIFKAYKEVGYEGILLIMFEILIYSIPLDRIETSWSEHDKKVSDLAQSFIKESQLDKIFASEDGSDQIDVKKLKLRRQGTDIIKISKYGDDLKDIECKDNTADYKRQNSWGGVLKFILKKNKQFLSDDQFSQSSRGEMDSIMAEVEKNYNEFHSKIKQAMISEKERNMQPFMFALANIGKNLDKDDGTFSCEDDSESLDSNNNVQKNNSDESYNGSKQREAIDEDNYNMKIEWDIKKTKQKRDGKSIE